MVCGSDKPRSKWRFFQCFRYFLQEWHYFRNFESVFFSYFFVFYPQNNNRYQMLYIYLFYLFWMLIQYIVTYRREKCTYFDNPILFILSTASSTKAITTLLKENPNPNINHFQYVMALVMSQLKLHSIPSISWYTVLFLAFPP